MLLRSSFMLVILAVEAFFGDFFLFLPINDVKKRW
jgi:hypothetical protein